MPTLHDKKPLGAFGRVEQFYRKAIATASQGEKLPSVRQVMGHCKVSRAVVDRALSRLHGEGLIESRERSGLYRVEGVATGEAVIDVLDFAKLDKIQPGSFQDDLYLRLAYETAGRSWSLRIRLMQQESNPRDIIRSLARNPKSRVLISRIHSKDMYYAQMLQEHGIPVVHAHPDMIGPVSPSLEIDDEKMTAQQVDHLVRLGHRKIGYLHSVAKGSFCRPTSVRLGAFYRLCVEQGLQVRPEWIRYVDWDAPEQIRAAVTRIVTGEDRPTAVIIYDVHAMQTYAALRDCGLTPGVDISVVGTDDMPLASHMDPPLTTCRVSREQSAKMLLEMLDEVCAGKDPGVRYLETGIVERKSTCAV